jgi:hypothetical protein
MQRLAAGDIIVGNSSNIGRPMTMSGDATISNTAVVTIANNSVDGTDIALGSDAAGDVMYYNGTDYARLGLGNLGESLKINAAGTAPYWGATGNTEALQPKNVYIQGIHITPTCSVSTGGASVGADTTITMCNLGWDLPGMAIYHTVESAGREGPEPIVDANATDGFYVPGSKNVDNTGATITFGGDMKALLANPTGPTNFIVGTDAAFYMKVKLSFPAIGDYDVLFVGFVEAEAAYVAGIDTQGEVVTAYDEKYGFSLADDSGDVDTNTSKAGADVNTDLTVADIGNDEIDAMAVYVSSTGVVTYKWWDGAAETEDTTIGAAAITVTDTTVLTPVIIHAKDNTASADTPIIIESIEWGYQ